MGELTVYCSLGWGIEAMVCVHMSVCTLYFYFVYMYTSMYYCMSVFVIYMYIISMGFILYISTLHVLKLYACLSYLYSNVCM